MAHLHPVIDNDSHYLINPSNRTITKAVVDSEETSLTQLDHNSQRVTFEIPRIIDGHDMQLCNVIRVHFINTEFENQNVFNKSVYDVDDLSIKQNTVDTLVFSWLISRDATMYVGTVSFSVEFSCVSLATSDDQDRLKVEYSWRTTPYVPGFNVKTSIDNSDTIVGETYDTVNTWVDSAIQKLNASAVIVTQDAKVNIDAHAASVVEDAKEDLAAHSVEISDILVQTTGQDTRKIMSQKAVTDTLNSSLDSYNTEYVEKLSEINESISDLTASIAATSGVKCDIIANQCIIYDSSDIEPTDGSFYRIRNTLAADDWGFSIFAGYSLKYDGGTRSGSGAFTLPDFDQYSNIFKLKILSVSGSFDVSSISNNLPGSSGRVNIYKPTITMVCDINGVRTTVTASETSGYREDLYPNISFDDMIIVVEGADEIYRVPDGNSIIEIDSHGITDISKTATNGLVDTYTITLDNGTNKTFKVTNGEGIQSIELYEEGDYEDTYRILLTSGAEIFFEVPNSNSVGVKGAKSGGVVYVDDVSPTKHSVKVNVRSDAAMDSESYVDVSTVQLTKSGKNMVRPYYQGFDNNSETSNNGITYTKNSDGTITVIGAAYADSICWLNANDYTSQTSRPIKLPAGNYVLSGCPSGGAMNKYRLCIKMPGENYVYDVGEGAAFTLESESLIGIYIIIKSGIILDNVVFKPQLEVGTVKTDYVPPDGVTYALDSTGAPMTRIPAQAPNMTLYTDTLGTAIDMEYNQDINIMFAKINAILERIMEGGS